jgi:hypothetical protein
VSAPAHRPEKTSPATRPKLEHFGAIINEFISIWKTPGKMISAPWAHPRVLHFDLHAATGHGVEGRDGSALIALRNMLARDLSFESFLFEQKRYKCDALRENIVAMLQEHREAVVEGPFRSYLGHTARRTPCIEVCPVCHPSDLAAWIDDHAHIIIGDHNETIDGVLADLRGRLRKRAYGLVVADPYGISDLGQEPLIKLSREPLLQRVDQLVNVATTAAKRGGYQPAYDLLAPIQKTRRLVRETLPGGVDHGWNWTMFLFSNWRAVPAFIRLGFHDTQSPEGKQLLDRFGLTERQRRGVTSAPFAMTRGTGATPSTSPTPGFGPCEPMSSPAAAASVNGSTAPEPQRSIT